MTQIPDILSQIIAYKQQEVIKLKQSLPLADLQKNIKLQENPRKFLAEIEERVKKKKPAVIAEIKKASPSKSIIRSEFDVEKIAKSYARNNATCLSILTDEKFFHGNIDYIRQAKKVCDLPILRKDFIIDSYQIYHSRAIGADCILLIVAALTQQQLTKFISLATELKLDVLLEVHTEEELNRALPLKTKLIGINNRNLQTFETNIKTTLYLKKHIPNDRIIVTESGIATTLDVKQMLNNNIYTFLIGEAFMKEKDPGKKLSELFV